MTTIHTIEDLIRILDEHPEWLEALRTRLLTRELLELPQRFAEFAETTRQEFEAINKRFEAIDKQFEAINKRFEAVDKQFEAINKRFEAVDKRFDGIDARLDRMDIRFDGIDARLDRMDIRFDRIEQDIAPLKGAHAANVAVKQAALIAVEMGLVFKRVIETPELVTLTLSKELPEVPNSELASFRRADLVIEAVDGSDAPCYLPVEASYTVNGRDTRRAIRNAEMLTAYTGAPAHAVVAGVRLDDRVRDHIAAGEVHWYEIDTASLRAE